MRFQTTSKRQVLASVTFFGLVLAVLLLIMYPKVFKQTNSKRSTEELKSEQTPLFYTSIGKTIEAEEAADPRDVSPQNGAYTIEFLVTESKQEAQSLVERLQKKKIQAYYMPLQRDGQIFYRVRSSIFSDQDQARKASLNLGRIAQTDSRVVPL